jgi:hypothetical protein
VAICPYACGTTGEFWRYKFGAMQHLVCDFPRIPLPRTPVNSVLLRASDPGLDI